MVLLMVADQTFGEVSNLVSRCALCDNGANLKKAEGDWWTDDYMVQPIGILECPGVITTAAATSTTDSDEEWEILPGNISK